MKVYLFYDKNFEVKVMDWGVPTDEILEQYPHVEYSGDIPEREGYTTKTKIEPETLSVYFEYEEIPKAQEEIQQELINTLGQELASLKIQLIMGGVI